MNLLIVGITQNNVDADEDNVSAAAVDAADNSDDTEAYCRVYVQYLSTQDMSHLPTTLCHCESYHYSIEDKVLLHAVCCNEGASVLPSHIMKTHKLCQ